MTPAALLERGLGALALGMPSEGQEKLLRYMSLLAKWNRTYNLTAIRDPLRMVTRHLLDSLAVIPHLALPTAAPSIADVGSGAGLPGIPLAIARPEWLLTLNDASQKKAAFLRQAAIELDLPNVAVHEGRVELWQPAVLFAVVISRAFAELGEFIAKCRHLLAPDGRLIAMTGTAPREAHAHLRVVPLHVPLLEEERHLIIVNPGAAE